MRTRWFWVVVTMVMVIGARTPVGTRALNTVKALSDKLAIWGLQATSGFEKELR